MKVKVVKKFKDKHTGEIHKKGDVLTVTKKRFAEILETAPLVEEIKEDAETESAEATE